MNTTAIYHRPESEFAYLYEKDKMHIRLRTARQDVRHVQLLCGDPYTLYKEAWYQQRIEMKKILSTDLHDYWQVSVGAEFRRLSPSKVTMGCMSFMETTESILLSSNI